ncbi:MAG: hypothetical protein HN337_01175 [Deltaproteobacteria bacterium]|jgi:hypothetical protein|nr:hypothetical protein [Deltaproteobacteria bacterium]
MTIKKDRSTLNSLTFLLLFACIFFTSCDWGDSFTMSPRSSIIDDDNGLQEDVISNNVDDNIAGEFQFISPTEGETIDNGCSTEANDLTWNFLWSPMEGAIKYNIKVTKANPIEGALTTYVDQEVEEPSFTYSPDNEHYDELDGWRWQVRAFMGEEWGEWLPPRSFKLEAINTDCVPGCEGVDESFVSPNPPSFGSVAPSSVVTIKTGEGQKFVVSGSDKDEDDLKLSVQVNPFGSNQTTFPLGGISITKQTDSDPIYRRWDVVISPATSLIGKEYSILFTLNDCGGGVTTHDPITFKIESSENDPPTVTLTPLPDEEGKYHIATGGHIELVAEIDDSDFGDSANLVCTNDSGQGEITYCGPFSGHDIIHYTAPDSVGNYEATFTAVPCETGYYAENPACCDINNGLGCCEENPDTCGSETVTFSTFTPPEDNHPPAIISIFNPSGSGSHWMPGGCTTTREVTVNDQDGDAITLFCTSETSFCAHVSFQHVNDNKYEMVLSPPSYLMSGTDHGFMIRAFDGSAYSDYKQVVVHIENDLPCPGQ